MSGRWRGGGRGWAWMCGIVEKVRGRRRTDVWKWWRGWMGGAGVLVGDEGWVRCFVCIAKIHPFLIDLCMVAYPHCWPSG